MQLSADDARRVANLLKERRGLLRTIANGGKGVVCEVRIGKEYRLPVPRITIRNVIQQRITRIETQLAALGVTGGQE